MSGKRRPWQLGASLGVSFLLTGGFLWSDQRKVSEQLRAQGNLAEALLEHFEDLNPGEGLEARMVELQAELDAIQAASKEGDLEPEKLAELEREVRLHSPNPDEYRFEFRHWLRLTARGERLPELRTRSGITYRDVVIRRVTEVGLEVLHATGTARLRHGDLPEHFQERFLWDEEEALESLAAEEKKNLEIKRLQVDALERGQDPVIARLLEKSRLVLGKIEGSDRILPAKLEPSGPLKLAELEPAGDLTPRRVESKKGR